MMSSCCYACGIKVLACRDFNEIIDDPIPCIHQLSLSSDPALIEGPPIQTLAVLK